MTVEYTKKLENLVKSLVPKHIRDNYPKYVEFVKVYLRYLDENYGNKILYITDNCNPETVYEEMLDAYLQNYFKDVVNLERYELTLANKRRLVGLSKMICNLKGNKKSFQALFKSLIDITIHDPEDLEDIDEFNVVYSESEGTLWTYTFQVNIDYAKVSDLVSQLHPAGFNFVFEIAPFDFKDVVEVREIFYAEYTSNIQYNGEYYYDGTVHYFGLDPVEIT